MYRPLHTLNLVLPKRPRFSMSMTAAGPKSVYRWPCGCSATGPDDSELSVVCCGVHADLLAPSSRGVTK